MTITSSRRRAALIGLRSAAFAVSLVATMLVTAALAAPAQATAYRYWSYWLGTSGTWVAAQTGPGDHTIIDQDVQGWRFGITTEAPAATPDNDPDFTALCPQLAADGPVASQVRVAVVIDSGFIADAPEGQAPPADRVSCVTVPDGATGNQALAAAGSLNDEGGLVCGINGYPEGECGQEVPDDVAQAAAEAAASETPNPALVAIANGEQTTADDAGSSPVGLWVAVIVIAGLAGAAVLIPRRRARADS